MARILICENAAAATLRAAMLIAEVVRAKPSSVLGLATGGTMETLYEKLCAEISAGALDLSKVITFNLDEYIGLPADHPQSYRSTMERLLFSAAGMTSERTHLPDGMSHDPHAEAVRFEELIAANGGIDLQLLGIGENGHIGFNEPSSSLGSKTRVKTLAEETRRANARYFDDLRSVPRFAITMGIGTILAARRCLLLATGKAKARAVADAIEGPVSAGCPASALQFHPDATFVLDRPAADRLRLREYYMNVHPNGQEALL